MAATFEQDLSLLAFSLRFADAGAFLRLEGEIDSTARPVLADIAMTLNSRMPEAIFVDLGAVSFAGSALINFLERISTELSAGAALVLCRPVPATARLIQLTDINNVVRVDDNLPKAWPPDQLDPVGSRG